MKGAHSAKTLKQRWSDLHNKKLTRIKNAEEYASYTLPSVFPPENSENMELQVMNDPIGAKGANHLSNKVVNTLFPPNQTFFRLVLNAEVEKQVEAAIAGQTQDLAKVGEIKAQVDEQAQKFEKAAMDYLDMVQYRPQAIMAAKLLVITGNACMYHPEKGPAQTFNLRDYCIVRDLSGGVIELMLRESKAFATFSPAVQEQLRNTKGKQKYEDDTNVTIFSQFRLEDDGKYHLKQAADEVLLDSHGTWTKDDLPFVVLVWNLARGEDYGRGHVEDYAGAFHALKVYNQAALDISVIMADQKYLVDPQAGVDIELLNSSAPGTYHNGRKDAVTAIQSNKVNDLQAILQLIERLEKQVSEAFLLMSTRQAERVTQEEIRRDAMELETSNAGIYSRLAAIWQAPTANLALTRSGFDPSGFNSFTPKVITGMDNMSRASELERVSIWLSHMGALNNLPEDTRAEMDQNKFGRYVGRQVDVDAQQWMKTAEQKQAELEQAQALQQQQNNAAVNGQVAVEAGKAAFQGAQ